MKLYTTSRKKEMEINNNTIENLREQFGEAFYILNTEQFRKNFLELRNTFSTIYPNFNIAYSYKTNYIPKLCRIVNTLGGYAEVVSDMELEIALRIGVRPEKIIWNGPIKNPSALEQFALSGGTVNMDSHEELEFIRELAAKHRYKTLNIGIRCNYDVKDGVVSRFGFDTEGQDFLDALNFATATDNVHFINYQCHFAKRQIEYWPARAKGMVNLIDKTGIVPERIDIGGGLFGKMEDTLKVQFSSDIPNYQEYAVAAATVFADYFKDKKIMPELIIEPGSAIVGDCMKFVGTVKTIKSIRGKYYASVLGSQKNISMSGVNPPMTVIPMGNKQEEYKDMDIVGFTCIENDVLFHGYNGKISIGDAIVISNCGSYSLVMKPPFILPNFPVLDICNEKVEVIKRGETFDDLFHTFSF